MLIRAENVTNRLFAYFAVKSFFDRKGRKGKRRGRKVFFVLLEVPYCNASASDRCVYPPRIIVGSPGLSGSKIANAGT